MKEKFHYITILLMTGFFSMIMPNTPTHAKEKCPIHWGMDKTEFLSLFPDAFPDPDYPHPDINGKYGSYALPDNNKCSFKYSMDNDDRVAFLFSDSEKLDTIRVETVNYEKVRQELIKKFGKPVRWETDGECLGEDPCYKRASFNDKKTKSTVSIATYLKDGSDVLILYYPYPPQWFPSSW